ncbi:hypothetical protein FQN51_002769 [Onygenales sp. PD_10]|nr:hypothetical protein FQN51_002769 [Onygenales sp. PD_10]
MTLLVTVFPMQFAREGSTLPVPVRSEPGWNTGYPRSVTEQTASRVFGACNPGQGLLDHNGAQALHVALDLASQTLKKPHAAELAKDFQAMR